MLKMCETFSCLAIKDMLSQCVCVCVGLCVFVYCVCVYVCMCVCMCVCVCACEHSLSAPPWGATEQDSHQRPRIPPGLSLSCVWCKQGSEEHACSNPLHNVQHEQGSLGAVYLCLIYFIFQVCAVLTY